MSDEDDKTVVIPPSSLAGKKEPAPKAKLVCQDGALITGPVGREISLHLGEVTVGRGDENKVAIKAKSISRVHTRIFPGDGMWGIEDLGSTNGVQVNGVKITQTWLKSGDQVIIGKVPYAYELERPDIGEDDADSDFDPTATMVDKTMMVSSDVRAAAALLRSAAKDSTEEAPPPERPAARKSAKSEPSGRAQASAKKKGGAGKWIAIAVVVLIAAGAGLYFADITGSGKRADLIAQLRGELKSFVSASEFAESYSKDAVDAELAQLGQIEPKIQSGLQQYPKSGELLELQGQAAFLRAERVLVEAVEEGDVVQAYKDIAALYGQLQTQAKAQMDAGVAMTEKTGEYSDLLQLSANVAKIKVFLNSYPDPANASNRPARKLLDQVLAVRKEFAGLKKRHNLALSVTYPALGQVVDAMDEKDINTLDKWNRVVQ